MISVSNIQRFTHLSFDVYKQLPGYSHSWLKREVNGFTEDIKSTPKMQLGTLVDEIRTGGSPDMRHELYPAAKKIAHYLIEKFPFLDRLVPQVSYTGVFTYEGFSIPVKGRPDYELPRQATIDLKVTHAKDVDGVHKFMGYENQQFGYARLAQVPLAYILTYCVPLKQASLKCLRIGDTNRFWVEKILKFGRL